MIMAYVTSGAQNQQTTCAAMTVKASVPQNCTLCFRPSSSPMLPDVVGAQGPQGVRGWLLGGKQLGLALVCRVQGITCLLRRNRAAGGVILIEGAMPCCSG
jgi:hypothetical protein